MTIKFVTLNLWLGGILMDEIIEFLQQQDADIVIFQEAYNGTDSSLKPQFRSMQVLNEALGYEFSDFSAAYRDFDIAEGKAQRGNGVLTRFPITQADTIFLHGVYSEDYRDVPGNYQNCPRNLQHVTLDTPSGELNVFNIQGVWDLDGDSYSEQRRQMTERTLEAIVGKPNVILAGDTNATSGNQAIHEIEKRMDNIFGRELVTTFNMKHKDRPGYATAVVDCIFVDRHIKVVEKQCHDNDVSDHLSLSAVLEI